MNSQCDDINQRVLNLIPSEQAISRSLDKIEESESSLLYPTEYLNPLNISGMPPHELYLNVGALVCPLRNMDPSKGHYIGSRFIIISASGVQKGQTLVLPRIRFSSNETDFLFILKRTQYSIRLCFAMSINKRQGKHSKKFECFLPPMSLVMGSFISRAN